MGIHQSKTNAPQLLVHAFPWSGRQMIRLTRVPKMDSPMDTTPAR